MKPLLVEHVEAVLALNLWNYRMTLALMVGQTCLGRGLEGAARVIAVQSNLRVDELLLTTLLLIFTTPLIVFCFYIEMLYTALDGGAPRATLLGLLFHVPDRLYCFRSLATTSFHQRFCPPAECLPPTGAHTRSYLGSQSSCILVRCPRK